MDIGIQIIYLMALGEKSVDIHNMYHELTKTSPVFYYFEKNGFYPERLELIFEQYWRSNRKTI